jgi:1,4-alpha-glucan branching enzyme
MHLYIVISKVKRSCAQRLMELEETQRVLTQRPARLCHVDNSTKVIVYTRGPLLFAFNFHVSKSYDSYKVGVQIAGEYELLLNTDQLKFGGLGRLEKTTILRTSESLVDELPNTLAIPLPQQTAQVYQLARIWDTKKSRVSRTVKKSL